MLAASSGARRGELLALRWSDFDLGRGTTLDRARHRVGGRQPHRTGHQDAPESPDLRRCRDGQRLEGAPTADDRQSTGSALAPDGFVFSHSVDGSSPWHPDSTQRAFRRICRQAGVTGIRLHDLRHYVATRLFTAGVDVRTVAGRLGHRNPSTTLNVYSHFVPESDQEPWRHLDGYSRMPPARHTHPSEHVHLVTLRPWR